MKAASNSSSMADRRPRVHYVDWLRVLAVLLLFPYHVSRVFNSGEAFYVKHQTLSDALNPILWFTSVWHMPLLFFLAGASTSFALGKRSGRGYLLERVKRLFIPLVFGFLVLIPPQTWYGGRFNSAYAGSFWHYLTSGDWLVWNVRDGGDYFGGFGIGHLWFILVLFLISVFALPLFLGARREWCAGVCLRLSRQLGRPAGWLLAASFIFLGEIFADSELGVTYYLAYFLLGYLAFSDEAFGMNAIRLRRPALGAGIALSVFWVAGGDWRDSLPDPSFGRAGLTLLGCLAAWLVIVGLVGYGHRYLDRRPPALAYLGEGSYPVYLLHQTVIVVLAFYLVEMPGPWLVVWVLLLLASLAATFALYEGVRRLPLRFLLGMRVGRSKPSVDVRPEAIVAVGPASEAQTDGVVGQVSR